MKKLFIALILSTFYIILNTGAAYAQENTVSLGIYPPVLEIKADPPAKIDSKITIQNLTENKETLDISFKSFKPSEAGNGQVEFLNNVTGPDPLIFQKIKVFDGDNEIRKVELGPLESKDLKLEINLENGAPLGDYYFSALFVSETAAQEAGSGSTLPAGIATNIILSVGKKGKVKGEILSFKTPLFASKGPVLFTLDLQNDSDQYIVPTGRISIKNILGKDVGRIDILPQYVLGHSNRFLIDQDQATASATTQFLGQKVLAWPEKHLFGMYKANLFLKLSPTGPVFERSLVILSLPLYFIFGVTFVIFIILGIIIRVLKRI